MDAVVQYDVVVIVIGYIYNNEVLSIRIPWSLII